MQRSLLPSLLVDKLSVGSFFIMSSRFPSCHVPRFDYRATYPIPYSREQWESMLQLAEANYWSPYPVPGFSVSWFHPSIYSPGSDDLVVDFDDFVLDIAFQFTTRRPDDSLVTFLPTGSTLFDEPPENSVFFCFWFFVPDADVSPCILTFRIYLGDIPGPATFVRVVDPILLTSSSFRLECPVPDPPEPTTAVYAYVSIRRILIDGEPVPVP
jgi:hypothetical protein